MDCSLLSLFFFLSFHLPLPFFPGLDCTEHFTNSPIYETVETMCHHPPWILSFPENNVFYSYLYSLYADDITMQVCEITKKKKKKKGEGISIFFEFCVAKVFLVFDSIGNHLLDIRSITMLMQQW